MCLNWKHSSHMQDHTKDRRNRSVSSLRGRTLVDISFIHLGPWLRVEHRPSTTPRHRTLFWANHKSPGWRPFLSQVSVLGSCGRCFCDKVLFTGRGVSPTQTHLASGWGGPHLSDLYPLTCPAWVALPGAYAPAGVALWVIEVLKPSYHDKGWTMWQ